MACLALVAAAAGLTLAQGGPSPRSSANLEQGALIPREPEEPPSAVAISGAPASSAADGSPVGPVPTFEEDDPVPEEQELHAYTSHRILGSTLKPRSSGVEYYTNSSGGCVYVSSGNANEVWNTPVWPLPGSEVE
ncbi:MAG: hypothetical protein ACP5SI_03420 [Chloroflexia bacterium]